MRQTIVLSLKHQDSVPVLTQMKKTNTWIGTEVNAVQRMQLRLEALFTSAQHRFVTMYYVTVVWWSSPMHVAQGGKPVVFTAAQFRFLTKYFIVEPQAGGPVYFGLAQVCIFVLCCRSMLGTFQTQLRVVQNMWLIEVTRFTSIQNWFVTMCLTNRFQVTVNLFSYRSQMTSKCGKNKEVARVCH